MYAQELTCATSLRSWSGGRASVSPRYLINPTKLRLTPPEGNVGALASPVISDSLPTKLQSTPPENVTRALTAPRGLGLTPHQTAQPLLDMVGHLRAAWRLHLQCVTSMHLDDPRKRRHHVLEVLEWQRGPTERKTRQVDCRSCLELGVNARSRGSAHSAHACCKPSCPRRRSRPQRQRCPRESGPVCGTMRGLKCRRER
jgi:hypothetical protein